MYQDPRFYAQELSKAARQELDRAVERIMKRWFRPEVGPEIAVAVLMKVCAERLSESEDGQDRLIRHLKGWADTVTRNEAWMRAHRARGGGVDGPLGSNLDGRLDEMLRGQVGASAPRQSAPIQQTPAPPPSRYRPATSDHDSPPPGTMREHWAAREVARGRAGVSGGAQPSPQDHGPEAASVPTPRRAQMRQADRLSTRGGAGPQPTAEEIELLRQAAAVAGNELMSEQPSQPRHPARPTARSPAGAPVDPPWAREGMPTDPHWAERAADSDMRPAFRPATRTARETTAQPSQCFEPEPLRQGKHPATVSQSSPAGSGHARPGPEGLADFLSRL